MYASVHACPYNTVTKHIHTHVYACTHPKHTLYKLESLFWHRLCHVFPETLPGLGIEIKYLSIFSSFLLTTERHKAKSAKGKGRLTSEKTRLESAASFSTNTLWRCLRCSLPREAIHNFPELVAFPPEWQKHRERYNKRRSIYVDSWF